MEKLASSFLHQSIPFPYLSDLKLQPLKSANAGRWWFFISGWGLPNYAATMRRIRCRLGSTVVKYA